MRRNVSSVRTRPNGFWRSRLAKRGVSTFADWTGARAVKTGGVARHVKRAFKYRFYPTDEQAAELLRTFGCVRLVYNLALEERTRAWYEERRRISYVQSSALLTRWKKTAELAFLSEVSCVPLQQALRHLQTAFVNFFAKRAKYPRFKSRKRSRASAEYTRSAFTWRDGRLTLAKMTAPLDIRWSRPLPEGRSRAR